jgi:signal transduction histidine kinase
LDIASSSSKTMRNKLILSFILVVLVAVSGVIVLAQLGVANEVRSFMQTGGQQFANQTADELERLYAAQGSWDGAAEVLQRTASQSTGRSGHGSGPGNTAGGINQNLILADANRQVLAVTPGAQVAIGEVLPESSIANAIPLHTTPEETLRQQIVGYLISYNALRFGAAESNFLVERLSLAALLAGGAAGLVALLLGLYLTHRLLLPVRQLTQATRGLAAGDLSQRVPVSRSAMGRDELAELAHTFNVMADSLQAAQTARQAMTADIAHELRTPLSVQRATLEALQDGIYPLETDSLIPLLEQNHMLSRLVEDLRTLALSDAGQLHLERTAIDLTDFARRVATRFQAAADANQVLLQLDLPPSEQPCMASVDPLRLEQVLNNLLSNALRHTPVQGHVRLRLAPCQADQSAWIMQVEDSGSGIPEEALPHIFDRFYRADKSRSRQAGGSGLGLTIARDLMRAHGGELTAANLPGAGAQFTLHIPRGGLA